MAKTGRSKESTLSPYIKGSRVHRNTVSTILGRGEKRRNRDVVYRKAPGERVGIPELQDHLLLRKGYLPKYSGLPLQHFVESQGLDKGAAGRLKRQERYWEKKRK